MARRRSTSDPCTCGHDLTDHLPDNPARCDIGIIECPCPDFEADGDGYDPDHEGWPADAGYI